MGTVSARAPSNANARLGRVDAAFREQCGSMTTVMAAYARFHRRVFDPATPCSERRVLVIRESFSDIVGVGQMHLGFHRLMALALAMGRALVFSACESLDDKWLRNGDQLVNRAVPYNCSTPHLNVADLYSGFDGIDLRWTPSRQRTLRRCNFSETVVDLRDARYGPIGCEVPGCRTNSSAVNAFKSCRNHPGVVRGCTAGWNADAMYCDFYAKRSCPAVWRIFGGTGMSGPARLSEPSRLAAAPLMALYNSRRDAGGNGFPIWQLLLGNGVQTVAAPNGSTIGIASTAEVQGALLLPYRCWSYANFRPGPLLVRAMATALERLPARQPLVCVHARTLHVDDHRCFPNGRGCRLVEFRRLSYWNTTTSITHSSVRGPGGARGAYDGTPLHSSRTVGRRSPLWWQLELPKPLPVCKVTMRQGLQADPPRGKGRRRWRQFLLDANLSLVFRAADGAVLHRQRLLPDAAGLLSAELPTAVTAKQVRVERHFESAQAVLSLSDVQVYTDEPLTWSSVDEYVNGKGDTCKMLRWRGRCVGWGKNAETMLPTLGGWSGLMQCVSRTSFHDGLLRKRGKRRGRAAALAPPFYLSTDALGLQQLAQETYPQQVMAISAAPVASWEAGRSSSEYVKVLADYEVLRLCDAVVSPIESKYANTAVQSSLLVRKHLTSGSMCAQRRTICSAASPSA